MPNTEFHFTDKVQVYLLDFSLCVILALGHWGIYSSLTSVLLIVFPGYFFFFANIQMGL